MSACQTSLVRNLPYHFQSFGAGPAILWLHGFTGSHETFLPFAKRMPSFTHILVDLPGHGGYADQLSPARLRSSELAHDLGALLQHLGHARFSVIGYSMGGRIAIALAAHQPERVSRLLLESASPGLEGVAARAQRRVVDEERAEMIRRRGLTAFLDEWAQLPLFASQAAASVDRLAAQRRIRLHQSGEGLRHSLLGHGTGVQPSYWQHLHRFNFPVHLITGELDTKFSKTATRMLRYLPNGMHSVVQNAGHTIHIENEVAFTDVLKGWQA